MQVSQSIPDQQFQQLLKCKKIFESKLKTIYQELEDKKISELQFTYEFAQLMKT